MHKLPDPDRELARSSLLFGRVTHERKDDFSRGDFVIRNFVGIVPQEKAVVVGDRVRVGQTVQLQLRDAGTATEDLVELLAKARADHGDASAALLFSCAGRGEALFGRPHHDVTALTTRFGRIPIAGFFASGEIGPVGDRLFLHGFTASALLF